MKITTIVIDCDGCLTDGRQYITEDGSKLCKTFHSRDRMALRRILEAGYRVIIASADDWPGVKAWAETISAPDGRHVEFVHTRKKHELDLEWGEVVGIADDMDDMQFLGRCAVSFFPVDGDRRLIDVAVQLETKGGHGIMPDIMAGLRYGELKTFTHAIHS